MKKLLLQSRAENAGTDKIHLTFVEVSTDSNSNLGPGGIPVLGGGVSVLQINGYFDREEAMSLKPGTVYEMHLVEVPATE